MGLLGILRRIHNTIYAFFLNRYRTREVLKVYRSAHAVELSGTPIQNWPQIQARQRQEVDAIRAGKLEIVDRKSWQWPFLPASVTRLAVPIAKISPYNLRRISRTPVPRRAINLIKGAVISQPWAIKPIEGVEADDEDEQKERIKIAEKVFHHPNNQDSWQQFVEQGIEDLCIMGSFPAEMRYTMDPERPLKMWVVHSESVRIFPAWSESTPDMPHYAQMTGLKGERGAILFYDDELLYVRDNPSADSPFGLGKMEVGFQSIIYFLGIQDMSGRAGVDQVHKTWLWWEQPQADCFAADTDVLTKRGWINWADARKDDLFATRNGKGEFEWQLSDRLIKQHYKGPMIEFRNRGFNPLVTPNHRMYGRYIYEKRNRHTGEFNSYRSSEMFSRAADVCTNVMVRPGKERRFEGAEDVKLKMPVKCHPRGEDPNCDRCRRRLVMRRLWARRRAGIIPEPLTKSPTDFRIPTKSVWKGSLASPRFKVGKWSFDWNDWAAFLGIWMAEGSTSGSMEGARRAEAGYGVGKSKGYVAVMAAAADTAWDAQQEYAQEKNLYKVAVYQSREANAGKYKQIVALLRRMGLSFGEISDGRGLIFADREIWEHLAAFGNKYTKYVPDYIKDAPAHVISTFIKWAVMGDGWIVKGKRSSYFTASKRLADDMQELFQKAGSSAVISIYPAGKGKVFGRETMLSTRYCVAEVDSDEVSLIPGFTRGRTNGLPKQVDYDGFIYCATVPNSTLYCRRNGHAFWSGNSAYQIVRRHIQNELEGQAKVSIIGGMKKPDVLEINPVVEEDLMLNWQELLIRMIANAFDMSAMALGIEHDINKAVGAVLNDKDFRSCVVPMAKRLEEAFTRKILHEKLGWMDLRFRFLQLDDPDIETKSDLCARMYSANALTPNEFREKMGYEPSASPFADLTQAEQMLLNMEAMARVQESSQMRTQQNQLEFQQAHPEMMPPQSAPLAPNQLHQPAPPAPNGGQPPQPGQPQMPPGGGKPGQGNLGQPAPGSPLKITPGNVAKGGQPPSPKPLQLPKFPIAGSRYNAKDIARMPVNKMTDVWMSGELGPSAMSLLAQMMDQEPGILEEMTDEIKQFFDDKLLQEQKENRVKIPRGVLKKWTVDQLKRYRKDQNRINDFATWLTKYGRFMGRPGGAAGNDKRIPQAGFQPPGGKPGNLNPIRKH